MAQLTKIFLRPSARTPVQSVEAAQAVPGQGLLGDHAGTKRQVTILDLAEWERACTELGAEIDPGQRRANLVLDSLELAESRGRRLRIGPVLLEIEGETTPCELIEGEHLGLYRALKPEWRGGVFARVVVGGPLHVGDPADWVPRAAEPRASEPTARALQAPRKLCNAHENQHLGRVLGVERRGPGALPGPPQHH